MVELMAFCGFCVILLVIPVSVAVAAWDLFSAYGFAEGSKMFWKLLFTAFFNRAEFRRLAEYDIEYRRNRK